MLGWESIVLFEKETDYMKKSLNILYVVAILLIINGVGYSQKNEDFDYNKIKKIQLFKSNRREVESILRSLKFKKVKEDQTGNLNVIEYRNKAAAITVNFSSGLCSQKIPTIGDVVVEVYLFYFKPRNIKAFDLDLTIFERYFNEEGNYTIFSDEATGMKITGSDDAVQVVQWFPTEEQEEKYACRNH